MDLHSIFLVLKSGGWVMIMLAILAIILYFTAFELIQYVYRGNLNERSEAHWKDWVIAPETGEGQVGEIIHYTQRGDLNPKRVHQRFEEVRFGIVSRVNSRLVLLKTLVATAPLAGLLGTVIGMLATFSALAAGGGESIGRVAGGIHEALITTQTGLLIALPGVFVTLMIQRKKHSIEAALARLECLTLVNRTNLVEEEQTEE